LSVTDDFGGFAPPAFDVDQALVTLRRGLRDLKLTEHGNAYELRGKRVVELAVEGGAIKVRLARRPMATPEWDRATVASAAEQRKLLDEVNKRLAKWESEE
jgi:hypothetical protein